MNYTKTSVLFAAMLSLIITPVMMEEAFAAERIPGFMKTNIQWYATGQISEDEFVNALTYLMNKDIIVLDQARADAINELRAENDRLRQEITDLYKYDEFDRESPYRKQTTEETHQLGPENIQKKHIATAEVQVTDIEITNPAGIQSRWTVFVTDMQTGDIPVDINALIQSVLRESYMETNKDLQFYADKVRHFNDMKDAIRDEVTKVRNERQMAVTQFENAKQATVNPDILNPDILNPDILNKEYVQDYADALRKSLDSLPPEEQEGLISKFNEQGIGISFTAKEQDATQTMQKIPTTTLEPKLAQPALDIITELNTLDNENESMLIEFLKLQASYDTAEADALDLANQLQENLDTKNALREDIAELRDTISENYWPVKYSYYDENGRVISKVLESAEQAKALLEDFESQLQTMSDMTQMMQMELQDAMNKQAQAVQTLSAIMKSQHDTMKAIISNMRG